MLTRKEREDLSFDPFQPAGHVGAILPGNEGIYRQSGVHWYWNGKDPAIEIEYRAWVPYMEQVEWCRKLIT